MTTNESDLAVALRCADAAAELALRHYNAGVERVTKADGSPVSEADVAVEELLHELLGTARPHDALLGEELGHVGASDRVWILDPIDGTSMFVNNRPYWRVHLALEVAGEIHVAVVTAPP